MKVFSVRESHEGESRSEDEEAEKARKTSRCLIGSPLRVKCAHRMIWECFQKVSGES